MAGGTIIRKVGETNLVECDTWQVYTDDFEAWAGEHSLFTADGGTSVGEPKDPPPAGKYFVKGWWTDVNDKPIKEATVGSTIRFHIQTQGVKNGEKIDFIVYDQDYFSFNDKLVVKNKNKEINKITVQNNRGYIEWVTGEECLKLLEETFEGDEIELFIKCQYKNETIDLPAMESDYLALYEKEVLITVIIELPHSKETGWGAKGLAGHTGMAIGNKYFDYGPDYDLNNNGTPNIYKSGEIVPINEKEYDVDFNNDGDKDDIVNINENTLSFKNTLGRPWWGEMIAKREGIEANSVTLHQAIEFIKLDWKKYGTSIYGEVHKIEFYVKESEANKMLKWWENRYRHLKIYSVYPWKGEQCTTTVKTAIQEAFPFYKGINWIGKTTQKPSGLLNDLKNFISTSKQHKNEKVRITKIKEEANDWQP
ncbi:hypothetical protein [Capnocytophaga sp. oral taxon 338]|uniref:hypothetical protein n=2 Tax=unclassified Capnocytophaga TaxID=2640652 RepID=UPI000202F511|nr:hypothetical protein [Capnocytophaga sp. oral taxon 338]EGD33026.1 hypothetical protein HMPREF9071_2412 [Capnocytophaga sp. oral taxon 338 str. F0234]